MRARLFLASLLLAAGCTPSYVDQGAGKTEDGFNQVSFQVHDAYGRQPPECVAVLPLTAVDGMNIDEADTAAVRRAFFAHLSPQGKRVIKPARVDFVLAGLPEANRRDLAAIGHNLNCEALVTGRVLEFGSQFFGVYSRVAVGADLRMVRAGDGALLWEGRHTAASHGGSLPLSPIGIAMGILEAARNLNEEQALRVTDDLARRLVSTIPDTTIAALDDPAGPPTPVKLEAAKPVSPPEPAAAPPPRDKPLVLVERALENGDYIGALGHADAAVAETPDDGAAHFMRARVLIKLGEVDRAEPSVIQALAREERNPLYLNALGYLNGMRGRSDRALAAYRMAIAADPLNGFALYNSGVLLYRAGDDPAAADSFYLAGLAYIKAGNFGQAGKALSDLKELSGQGLDLRREMETLERALSALEQKG
jgi:Tfp pilus assembly protein PilF